MTKYELRTVRESENATPLVHTFYKDGKQLEKAASSTVFECDSFMEYMVTHEHSLEDDKKLKSITTIFEE